MHTTSEPHSAVLEQLDELIRSRSILNHPFYQAWTAGELSREQLATYARLYYPHVEAFPGYLRSAVEGSQDAVIRAELLDNLREEESVPKPHPELWLDFAEGMGLDAEEVKIAPASEQTRATVATFRELCGTGTAEALAALYAYESQQPEVARTKAEGLEQRYGVTDAGTLRYFTVHQEADQRHRQGERESLRRCLEAGATGEQVLAAAKQALDAYWQLLDGVCVETGISLSCN